MSLKKLLSGVVLSIAAVLPLAAHAQVPVTEEPNHEKLLWSHNPVLAHNKRFVYDFWREVFESGQVELADRYMAEDYIQHNPLVATGREPFKTFLAQVVPRTPIQPRVRAPLVRILAEGDIVTLVFARQLPDPQDASKTYTSTWFDMFRLQNGRIAEHWDPATKN
ncbi:nuclear transport factor 2 family protein [Acidovorax sp. NCPPB 4044]|uniref:nuclear transport factor 2 family protein n=1 Tax=Acidovorax sp. NCPPB 4044 TaxID=2940490 RepID=UPI00230375FF|nr:nuclear transport factor 2 family protein [Acidovorax sp. NCPPB 4044]MDA8521745.1 nuclear transport factor 2 family protein [Acidovorax sp. NCPPB 4044]